MSLTNALLERLPAKQVYQSTSMIRNVLENRPDFLQIMNKSILKAVVGHWVHEAMLPPLSKPIVFACSLRDPIERIKSQYRFDIGIRGGNWRKSDPSRFLDENRNVMVNFVTRAFPSVSADFDNSVSGCKAILSGMDCLFDIVDADKRIDELVSTIVENQTPVPRANESEFVHAQIPFEDDEIADYCDQDREVYKWFSEARQDRPAARNPVFNKKVRDQFARLGAKPFQPDVLSSFLSHKLAQEIHFGAEDPTTLLASLRISNSFGVKLEREIEALQ